MSNQSNIIPFPLNNPSSNPSGVENYNYDGANPKAIILKSELSASQAQEKQRKNPFDRSVMTTNLKAAKPLYSLGKALAKKGEWEKAIASYRKALEIDDRATEIYQSLGEALVKIKQLDEAVTVYRKAIEIQPDLWEVHHNLGDIWQGQRRLEEAIAAYNLAIELNPKFCWSYNNLGDMLRDREQWKEAADAYQKAIDLNPNFSWSHYNLGEVLVQQQKWDEAVVAYRFALQLQPDLPQVEEKLNHALHYRVKSNLNLALSYYRQAIDRDPTDIESYTKALEISPNEPELHAGLGTVWQAKGEVQKAIDAYRRAIALNPRSGATYLKLAEVLEQIGQREEAAECRLKALREDSTLKTQLTSGKLGVETANKLSRFTGTFPISEKGAVSQSKPKVAVVSWDMSHNPVGRAFLLADMVKGDCDVELIGPIFPFYGQELWPPLQNADIKNCTFIADSFKEFVRGCKELAQAQKYDFVYVGKARFPSLFIGMLIKYYSQCPLILDIDDCELSFFKNETEASWTELIQQIDSPQGQKPYSEIWTRFCENLIPLADALTVSNVALQQRYGGLIVRHARDEKVFDPTLYDRTAIRAEFGYGDRDKVVLFLGTPRPHKGIFRIAEALETINDPRLVLCIIGTINDKRVSDRFAAYKKARIDFHENQPWERLPELVSMADLICILQDPNSPISEYQIPAKLTDAIAMNVPVLITDVPPLADIIAAKCTVAVDDERLESAIKNLINSDSKASLPDRHRRFYFLSEFSYGVNAERIRSAFDWAKKKSQPWPQLFSDVFELVAAESGVELPVITSENLGNKTAKSTPDVSSLHLSQPLNILFFWKQNDSDIYGRRQDMVLKYLAQSDRVNKIIHFDAPISLRKLHEQVQHGSRAKFHQGNLVFTNTVERFLGLKDTSKIIKRTFIYGDDRVEESFLGRNLQKKTDYPDFVRQVIAESGLEGETIAWVCPVCFEFPDLLEELQFEFVVADLIDDQRKWDIKPSYAAQLTKNYQQIIERADVIFTNCEPVRHAFSDLNTDITVIPNGAELFEDESICSKPPELAALKGPIIGYVGNLSDRIDLALLKFIANAKKDWNFVIIGSAHGNSQIFELETLDNVHLLGVKVYDDALKFIRNFDVAIIPHVDNQLTRSMNPLKLYVYYSAGIPIVSSPISNIGELYDNIYVAANPQEFINCIEVALKRDRPSDQIQKRQRLLEQIDWRSRVKNMLSLIDQRLSDVPIIPNKQLKIRRVTQAKIAASKDSTPVKLSVSSMKNLTDTQPSPTKPAAQINSDNSYQGICDVCGEEQLFIKNHSSLREGYQCKKCKSSLRYRGQAQAILKYFSKQKHSTLEVLSQDPEFQKLYIYEPGIIGPFRKYFNKFTNYVASYYWEDVEPGQYKDGIQCQNLERLTHPSNHFDLIVSSDIMEHVRRPWDAFKEIFRILKPGGCHVFTVPVQHPMPSKTVERVDTSGEKDVILMEPRYHSAPSLNKSGSLRSLVYTDFGKDLVDRLQDIGYEVELLQPQIQDREVQRLITFVSKKPN